MSCTFISNKSQYYGSSFSRSRFAEISVQISVMLFRPHVMSLTVHWSVALNFYKRIMNYFNEFLKCQRYPSSLELLIFKSK